MISDDGRTKPEPKVNPKPLPKKVAQAKAKAAAAKKDSQEPAKKGCIVRAKLQNRKIATVVCYSKICPYFLVFE